MTEWIDCGIRIYIGVLYGCLLNLLTEIAIFATATDIEPKKLFKAERNFSMSIVALVLYTKYSGRSLHWWLAKDEFRPFAWKLAPRRLVFLTIIAPYSVFYISEICLLLFQYPLSYLNLRVSLTGPIAFLLVTCFEQMLVNSYIRAFWIQRLAA